MKRAAILGLFLAVAASAQAAPEDRFWLLWEHRQTDEDCDGAACESAYRSRLFTPENDEWLYRMFGPADHGAIDEGQNPDAPRICQNNLEPGAPEYDTERQFLSDKLDALRGLIGVGVDLRNMRPPPGYSSSFGTELQEEFETRLRAAGLLVLDPAEAARLPGQPKLGVFFSFTDPDSSCDYTYSVFASLTQTALLSRDLSTKLSVGVWSYSSRPTAEAWLSERELVVGVADAFVDDFLRANGGG